MAAYLFLPSWDRKHSQLLHWSVSTDSDPELISSTAPRSTDIERATETTEWAKKHLNKATTLLMWRAGDGKKETTNKRKPFTKHKETDGRDKWKDALRRRSAGGKNLRRNMAAYTCNDNTHIQMRTNASRWLMLPILNITPLKSLLSRRLHNLHFPPTPPSAPLPTPSSSSYLQWSLLTHLAKGLCCAFPNDELCISRCQFEKCNYHSDKADGLVLSGICCASIKWGGVKEREYV